MSNLEFDIVFIPLDRIQAIRGNDPEWADILETFMTVFPEFSRYRKIAPFDSGRLSSKYQTFSNPTFTEPKTIFENVIYYVANIGVRFDYGIKQWLLLKSFLDSGDWIYICTNLHSFLSNNDIQKKKKDLYWNIFSWMNNNSINFNTITIDHVIQMKNSISGLGVGFEGFMKSKFSDSDDFCEYSDINYKKGIRIVYGNITDTEIKKISEKFIEMGFGRVANRFMFQICHYSQECLFYN